MYEFSFILSYVRNVFVSYNSYIMYVLCYRVILNKNKMQISLLARKILLGTYICVFYAIILLLDTVYIFSMYRVFKLNTIVQ